MVVENNFSGYQRKAYRVNDFCAAYGIGRTTFYEEVKDGRLPLVRVGSRTLVSVEDAEAWWDARKSASRGVVN